MISATLLRPGLSEGAFDRIGPGGGVAADFPTRAAFVAALPALAGLADGATISAGGLRYMRVAAATAIPDAPDWVAVAPVWLEHYGITTAAAETDAVTDWTAEVQAAMDATEGDLLFSGWVKVTDMLTQPSRCRLHCPEGRAYGGLAIFNDYNLSAACVLKSGSGGEGARIGHLSIWFWQPDAPANRAALIAYPPAVDIATPRGVIEALRVERGINGVVGIGNCGGYRIGILELGCFGKNLEVDGALDFVHVESIHVWPFASSALPGLMAIWGDGLTKALVLRHADGWRCDKLASYRAAVEIAYPLSALPALFGAVQLDVAGSNWTQTSGRVMVDQLYSTKATGETAASLTVSGGMLHIGAAIMSSGASPAILVNGGRLSIRGGELTGLLLASVFARVTSGFLGISNTEFNWPTGTRTQPFIEQVAGRLMVEGCVPWLTTNPSPAVKITLDAVGNYVDAIGLAPHSVTLPAGPYSGVYLTGILAPLGTYANNAAAVGAGLAVGMPYKTATGEVRVVV